MAQTSLLQLKSSVKALEFVEVAKTMGNEATKIFGKVKAVRPSSRDNGQYWKPRNVSDAYFLEDCKDICRGNLDDVYCAGFSIIPGKRCFFYGLGVLEVSGKPSWTTYLKPPAPPATMALGNAEAQLILDEGVCEFSNRRKCIDETDEEDDEPTPGKPSGTSFLQGRSANNTVKHRAIAQVAASTTIKTRSAVSGNKTETGSHQLTTRKTRTRQHSISLIAGEC